MTTVVPKIKGEGKVVERKSVNKIMLKAILKAHQTMRDLSSTVWDTLLSTTCRSRHRPTQRKSDKRGKDTRGPPFVWAYLGLVKSLQQRGNAVGARTAQGIATYWAQLEPLSPMQICDEVRFCRLDKTYKADKRIRRNIVSQGKRLLVLEALSQTESERKYGRAPPTAMERALQAFLEGLLKTCKSL